MPNPLEHSHNDDNVVANVAGVDNHGGYMQGTNENKWSKNGFGEGVARQQTGKFSKQETEIVRKAVEDFCAMKQISVARLCSECDHKAELKGAWMEIAKRLPHRSVQSVYRHGLRQLHPFKRGAWTEDECELLVDLVQRNGKKWATIQQKLNRSADSCRDKYREMSSEYVKGRWKENESEMLKRLVREHLQAEPTADIKELGKHVESEGIKIPWSIISKRMGKRSRLSCFKKWQKMTGMFAGPDDLSGRGETGVPEGAATSMKSGDASITLKPSAASHHAAPTVGAAGAAMAAAVGAPVGARPSNSGSLSADFDQYLLQELASLGVTSSSDVNWVSLRSENAHERWDELLDEWQASTMDESAMDLPLSEMAQLMLDRKTSAQRAAETVEAVDLPTPETLHSGTSTLV